MTKTKPHTGIRLAAMMVDHLIMVLLVLVLVMPYVIYVLIEAGDPHDSIPLVRDLSRIMLALAAGYGIYYNKDAINGRSLSKRIFGLQVISERSGRPADPLRCMLRNITALIWPVEVVALFFNPDRRLGDYVAGTRVVAFDPAREERKLSGTRLFMAVAFTMGFMLFFLVPAQFFMQRFAERNTIAFDENSFNEAGSKAMQQHISDRFPNAVETADFRVYDRIHNDSLGYVSGVIFVREASWIKGEAFESAKAEMLAAVAQQLPRHNFRGRFVFRHQAPAAFTSRQTIYNAPDHLEPVDEKPVEEKQTLWFPSVFLSP